MAVKRQKNWLNGARVDTVHLREIESGVVGDFDDFAGKIMASGQPLVVAGFTLAMTDSIGNSAQKLILQTAGGILLHGTASEPGSIFVVPSYQPDDVLNTSNPNVTGSFTLSGYNYIGIDLVRTIDTTTEDIVKFRSVSTGKEFAQEVPLARTLQYRIVISASDFDTLTNVAPIARVSVDALGVVSDITDCRKMMFRLGSGGSSPNPLFVYPWSRRDENPVTSSDSHISPFSGADKDINSFVNFFHAMESRLWEVGGGEHWYSQTTDRDVLFIRDPASVFSNNENFEWTGTDLHWTGISFNFANSTAVTNLITAQTSDSSGLTDIGLGQCLYVDINRADGTGPFVMHKANLSSLGVPAIPGSRQIIAWHTAEGVFARGSVYPVGFPFAHATTSAYGVTKLWSNSTPDAIVPVVDASGVVQATGLTRSVSAGTLTIGLGTNDSQVNIGTNGSGGSIHMGIGGNDEIVINNTQSLTYVPITVTTVFGAANSTAINATGDGTGTGITCLGGNTAGFTPDLGAGLYSTGGGTSGNGIYCIGGSTSGRGIYAIGKGSSDGVYGEGGSSSDGLGVHGLGGATNGGGVKGEAQGTGYGVEGAGVSGCGVLGSTHASGSATEAGVRGIGLGTNSMGVYGLGSGNASGVTGKTTGTNARAVEAISTGTTSYGVYAKIYPSGTGTGVYGEGRDTGKGGEFHGGGTWDANYGGTGVVGYGGATNSAGVAGKGGTSGVGVYGEGGSSGNGTGVYGVGTGAAGGVHGEAAGGPGGYFMYSTDLARGSLSLSPKTGSIPGGHPTSPQEGEIYYNYTEKHFYGYVGTVGGWKQLDN